MGLTSAVVLLLPPTNSYWSTLTVAVIMKPDFGSVFVRTLLRALGTILGAMLAALEQAFTGPPEVVPPTAERSSTITS